MVELLSVALFLFMMLGISVYWTLYDHKVAVNSNNRRKITIPVLVAATLGATLGGGAAMGLAEQVVIVGWLGLLAYLSYSVHLLLSAQWIVPKLVKLPTLYSPADVIALYYGKWGKILAGVAIFVKYLGSIAVQIVATGIFFQYFLRVSHVYALVISLLTVFIYSALGVNRRLTLIHTVQFSILAIAVPMLLNLGLERIGGYTGLFEKIPSDYSNMVLEYVAIALLVIIPGSNPAILQQLLNSRDERELKFSLRLNALLTGIIYSITALLGFTALAMEPNIHADLVIPYFVDSIFSFGLKELVLLASVTAILSSGDSFITLGRSALIHDVINPILNRPLSKKSELWLSRAVVVLMGVGALVMVLGTSSILQLVVVSRVLWTSLLVFPLLAGLFGIRASMRSFFLSLGAGSLTIVVWTLWIGAKVGFNGYFVAFLVNGFVFFLNHAFEHRKSIKNTSRMSCVVSKMIQLVQDKTLKSFESVCCGCRSIPQLWRVCAKRIDSSSRQYTYFGCFVAFIYVMPYLNWSADQVLLYPHTIFMRFMGGFLAFLLVLRENWPEKLKAHLPLYWYVTLLYTLSFLTTFMVFETNASWESLSNLLLALFLLGILVDWLSFLVIMLLGIALAVVAYALIDDFSQLSVSTMRLQWTIYMYSFATAISVIFSRHKENGTWDQIEAMKHRGAYIAHETLAPLASIAATAQGLELNLPKLITAYEAGKRAGVVLEEIPSLSLEALRKLPGQMKNVSQCSLVTVDILLNQIKGDPESDDPQNCLVSYCIDRALETYPFLSCEMVLVSWDRQNDFEVWARPELLVHVIYNLIKNSLYQIRVDGRGEIQIWTEKSSKENRLYFKDTASGIEESVMPLLFKPGYTSKRKGNGFGLSFCKQSIESIGGSISVHSKKDEFTEFVITFPIVELKK